jgi:hypothetical protein
LEIVELTASIDSEIAMGVSIALGILVGEE